MEIPRVSCCDETDLFYDPRVLVNVWSSLIHNTSSSDFLNSKETFLHDVADIGTQVLSNLALDLHATAVAQYNAKNLSGFRDTATKFRTLISDLDALAASEQERLIGTSELTHIDMYGTILCMCEVLVCVLVLES